MNIVKQVTKDNSPLFRISFCIFFLLGAYVFYTTLPDNDASFLYVFVIVWTVLGMVIAQPSLNRDVVKWWYWIVFLLPLFILGFRDKTGIDDWQYEKIFYTIQEVGPLNYFITMTSEPGFIFCNYFIGLFTENYHVAQFIFAFIPLFLFFKSFLKYQKIIYVPLAVLLFLSQLYFVMISVSLERMFIALSIVFYSLDTMWDRDRGKFIKRILLASLFHYSSLIMLLFLPLFKMDIQKTWKSFILKAIVISPLLFLLVAKIAGAVGGERYQGYTKIGTLGLDIMALDSIPFLLFILVFRKRFRDDSLKRAYYSLIVLLCFSSIMSIYDSLVSLGRVAFFMNLSLFLLLPMVYFKLKNEIYRLGLSLLLFFYSFLYLTVNQFAHFVNVFHLYPYKNLFFSI